MSILSTLDLAPTALVDVHDLRSAGDLDAEAALELRTSVLDAVADGPVLVLLDIAEVERITPSAVAGMIDCLRIARSRGGDFRVHGESLALHAAHRSMRLSTVIRVYRDRSHALLPGL